MKSKKILSIILVLAIVFSMTIGLNPKIVYAADAAVDTWSQLCTVAADAPDGILYSIDVTADLTADSTCDIGSNKNIVIQSSNGSTITRHSSLLDTSVFNITNTNATLTLTDITLQGDGTTIYRSPMIWINSDSTFNMDAGASIKDAAVAGADKLKSFVDYGTQSVWATKAVDFNINNGFIQGSNGQFNPKSNITRAETAAVVLRLLQKSGLVDVRTKV